MRRALSFLFIASACSTTPSASPPIADGGIDSEDSICNGFVGNSYHFVAIGNDALYYDGLGPNPGSAFGSYDIRSLPLHGSGAETIVFPGAMEAIASLGVTPDGTLYFSSTLFVYPEAGVVDHDEWFHILAPSASVQTRSLGALADSSKRSSFVVATRPEGAYVSTPRWIDGLAGLVLVRADGSFTRVSDDVPQRPGATQGDFLYYALGSALVEIALGNGSYARRVLANGISPPVVAGTTHVYAQLAALPPQLAGFSRTTGAQEITFAYAPAGETNWGVPAAATIGDVLYFIRAAFRSMAGPAGAGRGGLFRRASDGTITQIHPDDEFSGPLDVVTDGARLYYVAANGILSCVQP